MQTFLPYDDFGRSARVLDNQRLGKQRVEAFQVLRALQIPGYGWQSHPVVKMWRGHDQTLVKYGVAICDEWVRRGFKDALRPRILEIGTHVPGVSTPPLWLGDPALHASHRSNLLRKNPEWYGQFGWKEPLDLPYLWPTAE